MKILHTQREGRGQRVDIAGCDFGARDGGCSCGVGGVGSGEVVGEVGKDWS